MGSGGSGGGAAPVVGWRTEGAVAPEGAEEGARKKARVAGRDGARRGAGSWAFGEETPSIRPRRGSGPTLATTGGRIAVLVPPGWVGFKDETTRAEYTRGSAAVRKPGPAGPNPYIGSCISGSG